MATFALVVLAASAAVLAVTAVARSDGRTAP
jgi:hypothetical protein